jgi:thioesterase domain-containing protein
VTTFAWITATLATQPENEATLVRFYRLVRPPGPGWTPIAQAADAGLPGMRRQTDSLPVQLLGWVLGCTFIYATLFGVGSALYGHTAQVIAWGFVWIASGAGLFRVLAALWRAE